MKKIFILIVSIFLCASAYAFDENLIKNLINEGISARQEHNYVKLGNIGRMIINNASELGTGYLWVAQSLFRVGNYKESVYYFTKALERKESLLDFEIPLSYYLRGTAYFQIKEFQNAIDDFDIAESYNSRFTINNCAFYESKAIAYGYLKNYDKGLIYAKKALLLSEDTKNKEQMELLIQDYSNKKLLK